jgi:hypothetical protein
VKEKIEDLLMGDLVKLDKKRVIIEETEKVEMTFQGQVLCIRKYNKLYDFLTRSLYKEMKRDRFNNLMVEDLKEGNLYIKDPTPIRSYYQGYPNSKNLKKSILKKIKNNLEQRGLHFVEVEKIKEKKKSKQK